MTGEFDPNWEHGHQLLGVSGIASPCRIICTDASGNCPIIVLREYDDGGAGNILRFREDGTHPAGGPRLINAPAPKRKGIAEAWINVYPSCSVSYETRDAADAYSQKGRIACLHVREEVEEGTGLDDSNMQNMHSAPEPEEPKTVRLDVWVNVYECPGDFTFHVSKEAADDTANSVIKTPKRRACKNIVMDIPIGCGLDD